ncbi:ABC transporter permease [Vulcanococcus limneticus]|uniref:ABC transporter permease n=1 Tax=Vulcanococcus limneticus TaxID=2170428 RepID=UPI00398C17D0
MKPVLDAFTAGWELRHAWWFTATARTRARFARTMLGSFWLGLSNVLSIAVLAVVYGTVFRVQNFNHYVVYLGTGLVSWGLIAASISSAPQLLEGNARQILNSNLHPVFYTLEEWSFQVQTFAQSFVIVILALMLFKPVLLLHLAGVGLLPLLNLLLFCYWLPLLVCLVGARYKDLYQLIPILLQLVFLLSPILYEKQALGSLEWITRFNPLYVVIHQLRHALIDGELLVKPVLVLLIVNVVGIVMSLTALEQSRRELPFFF